MMKIKMLKLAAMITAPVVLLALAADLHRDVDQDHVHDQPDSPEGDDQADGLVECFARGDQHVGSLATERARVS